MILNVAWFPIPCTVALDGRSNLIYSSHIRDMPQQFLAQSTLSFAISAQEIVIENAKMERWFHREETVFIEAQTLEAPEELVILESILGRDCRLPAPIWITGLFPVVVTLEAGLER